MKIYVHREAGPWVPPETQMKPIRDFFGPRLPDGKAWIWPRRMQSRIVGRPVGPREFRAITRGSDSHLFVDRSETPSSVAFLLAHELTHQLVSGSPTVHSAFDDARTIGVGHASDAFHETDAEERFCDGIAARLFPGVRYDRAWWRRRVG